MIIQIDTEKILEWFAFNASMDAKAKELYELIRQGKFNPTYITTKPKGSMGRPEVAMTSKQFAQIQELAKAGVSYRDMSEQVGIHYNTLKNIVDKYEIPKSEKRLVQEESAEVRPSCIKCNSTNIIKDGYRATLNGFKQRWLCYDCGKRFDEPPRESKVTPEMRDTIIEETRKGNSLRAIKKTLIKKFKKSLSLPTISKYIKENNHLIGRIKVKKQHGGKTVKYTLKNGEVAEGTPEEIREFIKMEKEETPLKKDTAEVVVKKWNHDEPDKAVKFFRKVPEGENRAEAYANRIIKFMEMHPKKAYRFSKVIRRTGIKSSYPWNPIVSAVLKGKVKRWSEGGHEWISALNFQPKTDVVKKEVPLKPVKEDRRVFRMKFMSQKIKGYYAQGLDYDGAYKRAAEDHNNLSSPLRKQKHFVPKPTKPFVEFESVAKEFHVILEGILRNAIKGYGTITGEEVAYPLDLKHTAQINNFFAELIQKFQKVADYFGVPNQFAVSRYGDRITVSYERRRA